MAFSKSELWRCVFGDLYGRPGLHDLQIKSVTVSSFIRNLGPIYISIHPLVSLRGRRTKGREGEVKFEREVREECDPRSLGSVGIRWDLGGIPDPSDHASRSPRREGEVEFEREVPFVRRPRWLLPR